MIASNAIKIFFIVVLLINSYDFISSLNIEELKSLNYEVDISQTPVKRSEDQAHAVYMTSKYGQGYQCILPQTEEEEMSEKETVNEKDTDVKELLKPMKSGNCLLKGKDWWTYEFCFGHYIKQFHIEDGQILGQVITLGLFELDYDWNNETDQEKFKHVKQRYHSQYYVNGTKCDLTGQPRTAEVRMYCEEDAGDYIYRVDEPGTCSYIITIHTSRLCSHPLLKPLPSKKAHTIPCHPVLNEDQYAKYLQKYNEEKELANMKRNEWLSNQQARLQVMKQENLARTESEEQAALKKDNGDIRDEGDKKTYIPDSSYKQETNDKDEEISKDKKENDETNDEILSEQNENPKKEKEEKINSLLDEIIVDQLSNLQSVVANKQRKNLEQAVKESLENAGIDGRRIEVKIIQAGYFDNEQKDFHTITDVETSQFQNMIMALLTGQQEAVQEIERHKKLEDNYKFTWEDKEDEE